MKNRKTPLSPITGTDKIEVERLIPKEFLIDSYMESYGIDVRRMLDNESDLAVYKCLDSGFRFYGPKTAAGDSAFYGSLQQFPWYYMEWKWEHQIISERLQDNSRILEIGCAKGAFMERIMDRTDPTGLELNELAAMEGNTKGLDIRTQTIQEHSKEAKGRYDVVCSFQVMEHVTDVSGIVQASLDCLKPGGELVISVPNNDSFIRHAPNSILNMPPHHMCLWDEKSLRNLDLHFNMELTHLLFEPLQTYHYAVVAGNWIDNRFGGKTAKVLRKIMKWTKAHNMVKWFKKDIIGHSVIAIYRKSQ